MPRSALRLPTPRPLVVGCLGDADSLASSNQQSLSTICDLVEIRLDLIHREVAAQGRALWAHLDGFPILFTARRHSEGSTFDLDAAQRSALFEPALQDAALIDIEVASIPEMIDCIADRGVLPWIASYHDFEKMPHHDVIVEKVEIARSHGAAAFKLAARLNDIHDLARLVKFQLSDMAIPLVTMGMGPLAPASRMLCAQAGSSLNYGFIGAQPTAPGQWSAALLKSAIDHLTPIH